MALWLINDQTIYIYIYIYIYALKDLMRMMVFTPRTARGARARGGDDSVIYDIFR